MTSIITLWRPVGRAEYDLLVKSGMRRWPPRLDHQPIFYPVLNRGYAVQIAREWNTKDEVSGFIGIVTEFDVDAAYAAQFDRQIVGGKEHEELWIPAEELEAFNENIVGEIRVVDVFYGEHYGGEKLSHSGSA